MSYPKDQFLQIVEEEESTKSFLFVAPSSRAKGVQKTQSYQQRSLKKQKSTKKKSSKQRSSKVKSTKAKSTKAKSTKNTSRPTSRSPTTGSTTPNPTTLSTPSVPLCTAFDCGDGYSLRSNPDTSGGVEDRATCCIRDGVCAGADVGSPCILGDIESSLIPNPSFEDFSCCPTAIGQLSCANGWVQATLGTADYFVEGPECDDTWFPPLPIGSMPQGASDGAAFVGAQISGSSYFEYVGACLTSPLQTGNTYTFTLDIAAAGNNTRVLGGDTSGTTEVLCIPSCDDFQIPGTDYKGDDYEILATASPNGGLVGGGEWKSITFIINPTQDCPAIMFGPGLEMTTETGQLGPYVMYVALNLQEGVSGVCDLASECVAQS